MHPSAYRPENTNAPYALAALAGLADEREIAGKTDYDLFDRALAEQYRSDDRKIMDSGKSLVDYVERIPSDDGVSHYSSTSKYLLYDAAGELVGLYGVARDITANREALAQLTLLTNSIPGGLAMYEVTPEKIRILYFSDGFYTMTGYTKEEYRAMADRDTMALIAPADVPALSDSIRSILHGTDAFEFTYRLCCKDGGRRWVNLRGTVLDRRGETVVLNAVKFDVTEKIEAEETLRMSEEHYRLALEHSGNIIARYDIADRSVNMTPNVAAIFGTPEKVTNVPYGPVEMGLIPADSAEAYISFYESIIRGEKTGTALFQGATADGMRWLKSSFTTIYSNTGDPVSAIIVFEDVTEVLEVKQKAERDGLTGLYNKMTTEALIRKCLEGSEQHPCALLIIDLDNLKTINDSQGHDHGDRAIRLIGETLRAQFRQNDIVGRIGGDEFAVFLGHCGTETWLHSTLLTLMKKLTTIRLGDQGQLPLRCSIGVVTGASGTDDFATLYKRADRALYHVKRNGKNDFAFYTVEMEEAAYRHKAHEEAELWRAGLFSKAELNRLLLAVAAIYPLVISANLTQNSYYMMQYEHYTTRSCVNTGVFDELIAEGSATFHPADRQSFIDCFSRANLLDAHARGERVVSHEGKQLGDDGVYRLMRTDVIFVESADSDDIPIIALAREVGGVSACG